MWWELIYRMLLACTYVYIYIVYIVYMSIFIIIVVKARGQHTSRIVFNCLRIIYCNTHGVWSIVLFIGSSHFRFVMNSGWSTSGWQFSINDEPIGLVCFGCVGLMIRVGSFAAVSERNRTSDILLIQSH